MSLLDEAVQRELERVRLAGNSLRCFVKSEVKAAAVLVALTQTMQAEGWFSDPRGTGKQGRGVTGEAASCHTVELWKAGSDHRTPGCRASGWKHQECFGARVYGHTLIGDPERVLASQIAGATHLVDF